MSVAAIIFNQSAQNVTLGKLHAFLSELGVESRIGEWRYMTESVPQIEIATDPPFALQLNDHADVRAENAELFEEEDLSGLPEGERARFLECDARLEVVSGEQPVINDLPGGGHVTYTPEADISSSRVQAVLEQIAEKVHGFIWLNV